MPVGKLPFLGAVVLTLENRTVVKRWLGKFLNTKGTHLPKDNIHCAV
jgi:hypothetical protein